mmetsp:Transcript_58119/g.114339  ORF Transcript_58119/g.114339 Transcript_58119/m.114339 type:complete len:325 (-) Transcript_58119:142-1116(-)
MGNGQGYGTQSNDFSDNPHFTRRPDEANEDRNLAGSHINPRHFRERQEEGRRRNQEHCAIAGQEQQRIVEGPVIEKIVLIVPEGAEPGDNVNFQLDGGARSVVITIPVGTRPGMRIRVAVRAMEQRPHVADASANEVAEIRVPATVYMYEGDQCCICKDPLNQDTAHTLSCGHALHVLCLREMHAVGINKCPLCREAIPLASVSMAPLRRGSRQWTAVRRPSVRSSSSVERRRTSVGDSSAFVGDARFEEGQEVWYDDGMGGDDWLEATVVSIEAAQNVLQPWTLTLVLADSGRIISGITPDSVVPVEYDWQEGEEEVAEEESR